MVKLFLAAIAVCAFNVSAFADCGGASFATPIRSLIAARPIQSTLQKIQASAQANRAARATGCSGERAASCSGPQVAAPSCTQSAVPQAASPCPNCNAAKSASVPLCENGRCDLVRHVVTAPARLVSSAYQQALASAQYRAANRIKGHTHLDTHRTSGVGWASHDASPNTCLGRGGDAYAVARGVDGFYSTKLQ